jgi:outer membrane protein OmpA-like peptidoglycan-associated protein
MLMATASMAQDVSPQAAEGSVGAPAQATPTEGASTEDQARIAALREEAARLRAELAQLLESVAARRAQGEPGTQAQEVPASAATAHAQPEPGPVTRIVAEIYFPIGSANVAPVDRQRLAGTAEALRALGIEKVQVIGYCDHTGTLDINQKLTTARARAVARELAVAGFDEGVIEATSHIDLGLPRLIPTAAGVSEALNRRVRVVAVLEPQAARPIAAAPGNSLTN